MIPQKRPRPTAYDYTAETDIVWLHHQRPAFLRETVAKMAPTENDYYVPSIQAGAEVYGFALTNVPHNVPRRCRVWFLLTEGIPDGLDIKNRPENTHGLDRCVDPDSIVAGKPSRPATPKRASRSATRFIKKRREYHARKKEFFDNGARWPSRWQKLKKWVTRAN